VDCADICYACLEAIQQANDTPYGLAAAVFTANISRAISATQELQAGMVWVMESFLSSNFGIQIQLRCRSTAPTSLVLKYRLAVINNLALGESADSTRWTSGCFEILF
jgi:hypothetical protein